MKRLLIAPIMLLLFSLQWVSAQSFITETYTTADGVITFDHPNDFVFYDSEDLTTAYTLSDESGIAVEIQGFTDTTAEAMLDTATALGDPIEVLDVMVGDREMTLVIMSVFRGIRDYRYIIDLGDGTFATFWILDERDQYEDAKFVLESIVNTIRRAEPAPDTPSDDTNDDGILYDTTVASYGKSFSITIPGRLFDFSATDRTPHNITMTNNWEILQDDGTIAIDTGDVLLVVDYFETASELDLPDDATLLDVTNAMVARSVREVSQPVETVAGDYEGYLYVSSANSLIFTSGMFDVGEGAFAGFTLLTVADNSANEMMDVALNIIGSLQKGLVFGRVGAIDLDLSETFTREEDNFTIPYPAGWAVQVSPVGRSQFVTVTKGHTFDMSAPPSSGQPSAIIAYGTMTELTELPQTMLNPETNAQRVIQTIIGATPDEIVQLEIQGYRAAQTVSNNPDFENWFIAIMLDDNHFIAGNMFTAIDEDIDFFGAVTEMMVRASWDTPSPEVEETTTSESPSNEDTVETSETDSNPDTFVSEFHNLTFDIPAGWLTYDLSAEILVIINTSDAFDAVSEQLPPDSGEVLITIFTHETINTLGNDDPDLLLEFLNQTMFTEDVDDLVETEIDGQTVYVASAELGQLDRLIVLKPIGDDYELMIAETASGELEDYRDTLMAIVASMITE